MNISEILELNELAREDGKQQFKGINVEKKIIFSHSAELRSDQRPLSLFGFIA